VDLPALLLHRAYAVLLYLLCTLFFPEQIGEYDGFKGYYYSRRRWIFSLMALLFVADIVDTLVKGQSYFSRLGVAYDIRTAAYLLLSLIAIKVSRSWFHAAFAVFALVYEIGFILEIYRTIG
jgi:hypothetical protein